MREELEAVLLPGIDSTGVVSVDACVAGVPGPPCPQDHQQVVAALDGALDVGANSLASSLMRPTSTVPCGVFNLSMCHMGTPAVLQRAKIIHGKG